MSKSKPKEAKYVILMRDGQPIYASNVPSKWKRFKRTFKLILKALMILILVFFLGVLVGSYQCL